MLEFFTGIMVWFVAFTLTWPFWIVFAAFTFWTCADEDWKAWRQDFQRSRLGVKQNVDKISYWITSWPVSFLTWGLHDILTFVKRFITVYARKLYDSIAERHIEK